MQNAVFDRVFNLLPEWERKNALIAGGAAFDFLKASDVDVFVLDRPQPSILRRSLHNAEIPGIKWVDINDDYPDDDFTVVANVEDAIVKIQFISTKHKTALELLSTFDISTHCWAIDPEGNVLKIHETTGLEQSPKVVHLRMPERTLCRYRKICLRYGLEPNGAELVKICATPDPEKQNKQEAF